MQTKLENPLPKKMRGSVHAQYVRCGKVTCKCTRGELHGPYFYHFVRVGGRLRKRYLKAHEVEQMRVACATWRKKEKARRTQSRQSWQVIRAVNTQLRELLKQYQSLVGG